MKPQTIFFDLDDTLVHCNKYFDLVIHRFAKLLADWFSSGRLAPETVKRKQLELDLASVEVNGFTTEHFPQSFVDTYLYFSRSLDRAPRQAEQDQVRALGKSVYDMKIEPYPHMVETLQTLQDEGHLLYLYTGGVPEVQFKKVVHLGLEAFFGDRIHVTRHKTNEAMEEMLSRLKVNREASWMIGNSLRTDIVPALEAGIHAVYIPASIEWQYNIVKVESRPQGAYLTLSSLKEVPDAIRSYVAAAR